MFSADMGDKRAMSKCKIHTKSSSYAPPRGLVNNVRTRIPSFTIGKNPEGINCPSMKGSLEQWMVERKLVLLGQCCHIWARECM
jgi:hypothetical protein